MRVLHASLNLALKSRRAGERRASNAGLLAWVTPNAVQLRSSVPMLWRFETLYTITKHLGAPPPPPPPLVLSPPVRQPSWGAAAAAASPADAAAGAPAAPACVAALETGSINTR